MVVSSSLQASFITAGVSNLVVYTTNVNGAESGS